MARIRTIKPEFPQSETIGRLSRESRLLFILIWTVCDDAGRTRGIGRILSSLLYPFDEDAPALMETWLLELEKENCVLRYKVDGNTYIQVCNWLKHQKIDRPGESRIPAFDEVHRASDGIHRASDADLVPSTVVPRIITRGKRAFYEKSGPKQVGISKLPAMPEDEVIALRKKMGIKEIPL